MFARCTKVVSVISACVVFTSAAYAKPKEWSENEAIAEAQHDIRVHKIRFYWHGGYASMPVGLPARYAHIAERYPHADGGIRLHRR